MPMHALTSLGLRFSRALLLIGLILYSFASARGAAISTVPLGNAGNAADTTGYGAVAYNYRIGTTEVTNAQYVAFLNEKAKSDPLSLFDSNMSSDARGGITRSGSDGSYIYAPKTDMGNKPVNYVSWYDSIRFANWLNNGQGTGDTETGAYTLLGGTATPSNGLSITRNAGATWWLPSENEWYKAAYHQPAATGGDADDYWRYATASNSVPTIATANSAGEISNPGPNVANYLSGADWNALDGNVTTVGSAGLFSDSFYGTSDQGGNVWEWNDTEISRSLWGLRGGSFDFNAGALRASDQYLGNPTVEDASIGFRVATVPEPSTYVMAAMGAFALLAVGRRKIRN